MNIKNCDNIIIFKTIKLLLIKLNEYIKIYIQCKNYSN